MLSRRYQDDGRPTLKLNALQAAMKEEVSNKVKEKHYIFEQIPCCVCSKNDFELLAAKDRYGLYMPVVICKVCGLIQTNPRMNQASYEEFYNTEYRKLYLGREIPGETYFVKHYKRGRLIYEYVMELFSKNPLDMFVLEVGCSSGASLKYFKEQGCSVYGIDLDEESIRYGKNIHSLDLYCGKLSDLKLDRKPDLVIYSHTLEHLLDPIGELKVLYHMLADGLVFVSVPGVRYLARSHLMDFLFLLQNAHTYHFTLTTLKNLMGVAGFDMVQGDERIWSLFRQSTKGYLRNYENDYADTMIFLKRMERWQHMVPLKSKLKAVGARLLSRFPRLQKLI